MEQPMFSLASYHGERKLAWKRICNKYYAPLYIGGMKSISQVCTEVLRDYGGLQVLGSIETTDITGKRCHPLLGSVLEPQTSSSETCERERGLID